MKTHVLIIEDDVDTAELMRLLLVSRDFEVTVLHDRTKVVDRIMHHTPNLALIDLCTDGPPLSSVIEMIRTRCPHVRLALVSCAYNLPIVASALGIRFTLKKPFEPDHFFRLVDEALSSHETSFHSIEPPQSQAID